MKKPINYEWTWKDFKKIPYTFGSSPNSLYFESILGIIISLIFLSYFGYACFISKNYNHLSFIIIGTLLFGGVLITSIRRFLVARNSMMGSKKALKQARKMIINNPLGESIHPINPENYYLGGWFAIIIINFILLVGISFLINEFSSLYAINSNLFILWLILATLLYVLVMRVSFKLIKIAKGLRKGERWALIEAKKHSIFSGGG